MDITNRRRAALYKRIAAGAAGEYALQAVFRAIQEAETGTALPASFPYLSKLTPVGYTTKEDLSGVDADELRTNVQLGKSAADQIIAAAAKL